MTGDFYDTLVWSNRKAVLCVTNLAAMVTMFRKKHFPVCLKLCSHTIGMELKRPLIK